jgi:uncharacterized BrkB/YihY/UPF0761 family membrane protein
MMWDDGCRSPTSFFRLLVPTTEGGNGSKIGWWKKRRFRPTHTATAIHCTAKGWKDIAWRTDEQIQEDRLLAVAAGVVFYGLLALFPAITALVSSYALFTDAKTINDYLSFLAGMIPQGTYSVIQVQISRVLAKGEVKLGAAFVFSLMLALLSANGGMKAIIDALNVVYGKEEKRGFLKLNAISLAFTLGSLLAVLTAMGLVVVPPIVHSTIGSARPTSRVFRLSALSRPKRAASSQRPPSPLLQIPRTTTPSGTKATTGGSGLE